MIKRFSTACVMTWVLLIGTSAAVIAPTNFAGVWVLDQAKSQGLPENVQNLPGYTMVVTQDDKQLTVEIKAGAGEQGRTIQTLTYKLDGSETTGEMAGRRPGPAKLNANWKNDGKILELTAKRQISAQGREFTITIKDRLELAEDGKALRMLRTVENPRGAQESTWVFNKK